MVVVSRSGAVRSKISWRNVQQDTARIARTVGNLAICRAFLRATLREVIDRQWLVIDRSHKYRPRSGHMENCCFAGLSPR